VIEGACRDLLANKRTLASYIDTVRRIGGVKIEDTIPDNKPRTATGWRLHAMIRGADLGGIISDLTDERPSAIRTASRIRLTANSG
jgi:hypothetical protein